MKDHNISNNIRLVSDLIDYSELLEGDPVILFLDFHKAFDSVSHQFIFDTLQYFKFGRPFIQAIKTLYNGGNSCVKLSHGTSSRFDIHKGVRQGCPVLPYIFLLVSQILCSLTVKSQIKGIMLNNREIKIVQLADDTTLFLKNEGEIAGAISIINQFSVVSGLVLNTAKCEILPLKLSKNVNICGIPVKSTVTYLGVKLTNKNGFTLWLARDLSLQGRVLLSKAEGLSRASYIFSSLNKSKYTALEKILYKFIWKNKPHKIKKEVISNNIHDGGLNVLNFTTFNHLLKIKRIKGFLKNPYSLWNIFPHFLFQKLGGLNFLLKCSFAVGKLPVKLAAFHKQVLTCWSLLYKHNLSPHKCYIWNDCYITHNGKTLFHDELYEKKILLVHQLMKDKCLFTHTEFMEKFDIDLPFKDFNIIAKSIPNELLMLFNNVDTAQQVKLQECIQVNGIDILDKKFNNRLVRETLNRKSTPAAVFKWAAHYEVNWHKAWTTPHCFLLTK
ncbi:hypothetical protein LDENG_00298150 [Lucifuga dentata]|nr:hypothetical protein LDENG_00298150 [Lucifuga dentata]